MHVYFSILLLQIHDQRMALQQSSAQPLPGQHHPTTIYSSQASIEDAWKVGDRTPSDASDFSAREPKGAGLTEPLLRDTGTSRAAPHVCPLHPSPLPHGDTVVRIPVDSEESDHV